MSPAEKVDFGIELRRSTKKKFLDTGISECRICWISSTRPNFSSIARTTASVCNTVGIPMTMETYSLDTSPVRLGLLMERSAREDRSRWTGAGDGEGERLEEATE